MKVVKIEHENKEIALPLDKEHLAKFVSSLLGQPQSIEKVYTLPFVAHHAYFMHLISLIKQRLEQQNNYSIVSFQATIGYEDKTRRKYTSIEAFENFSESFNVISTDINLKFGILIHFPKKDIPEKQEIDIDFTTATSSNGDYARDVFDILLRKKDDVSGVIKVEIRHTERTWSDDMMVMIENSFHGIWVKENSSKVLFRKFVKPVNFDSFFLFIMLPTLPLYFFAAIGSNKGNEASLETYTMLRDRSVKNIDNLHTKIDYFATEYFTPVYVDPITTITLICFIGMFLLFLLMMFLKGFVRTNPSFIVLTDKSKTEKESVLKKKKYSVYILSTVITILVGLTVNFLYDYLKNI